MCEKTFLSEGSKFIFTKERNYYLQIEQHLPLREPVKQTHEEQNDPQEKEAPLHNRKKATAFNFHTINKTEMY